MKRIAAPLHRIVLQGGLAAFCGSFACTSQLERYTCGTDEDCQYQGVVGVCEGASKICSFPDSECESGRRYGAAGDESESCVVESKRDEPEPTGPETDAREGEPDAGLFEPAIDLKINAGSAYADGVWRSDDVYLVSGVDWNNPGGPNAVSIGNLETSAPASVYSTVTRDAPAYYFDVPSGTYRVTLHFADAYTDRQIGALINGAIVLSAFDPSTAGGGINTASLEAFEVEVDAVGITLKLFSENNGDSFVAGIEILQLASP